MKHILAYGNSDQVSFRSDEVKDSFDYMSVPGTIASYYSEATAAFVLSSELDYLIDPRTPLFQNDLSNPRASHVTLAGQMGATVGARVVQSVPVSFPPTFYTSAILNEVVTALLDFQLSYADNAKQSAVQKKMNRYGRLLAEARNRPFEDDSITEAADPTFVLAPYFAVNPARAIEDPWRDVMRRIWALAAANAQASKVSPVICASDPQLITSMLTDIPAGLSDTTFFWLTGFDERKTTLDTLREVWSMVSAGADNRRLVNLYGGYFSACMHHAGLWGFNNGLGYSESRDWPQLDATGAAPLRYYVRDLHLYLPPTTAQALIDAEPALTCPCSVCAGGASVASMSYPDVKRHFALARKWEIETVISHSTPDLAIDLRDSQVVGEAAAGHLPERLRPSLAFLTRWATVLDEA